MRGPFRPKRGGIEARLSEIEADAVKRIATELSESLDEPDESMYRLFPPGYSDDQEKNEEFEHLTRDELVGWKRLAATKVIDSIEAGKHKHGAWEAVLDEETAHAWLGVLNDARLVIGTRIDVTEDTSPEPLPQANPRAPAHNLYLYLTGLEGALIDALSAGRFDAGA